jgi:hypothetical protein
MAGIAFMSEGATNQGDWKEDTAADLIANIEPPSGGRSIFLVKRECKESVDVLASERYFHIDSMFSMWKSSL